MKKSILFGAFTACALMFASCDFFGQAVQEGALGDAQVIVNAGDNGIDTLDFVSSVANAFVLEDQDNVKIGTIDLCANVDLEKSQLNFPFMGIQINDTNSGVFTIDEVLTVDRLRNFNFDTIAKLLRQPSTLNFIVLAENDTAWYLTESGNITVTEFPAVGYLVKGSFTNVNAYYFTKWDVDRLNDNMDAEIAAGTFSLTTYFHPVTMSGTFNSRRTTLADRLIEEAFFNRGLCNL